MDLQIYKAASSGNIDFLSINREKLSEETTQNSDTVLHLASQYGHANCVNEILKMEPSFLRKVNSRNETALHLAAQNGHTSVCEILIDFAKRVVRDIESGSIEVVKEMIWMQNKEKDTALHLASLNNFHLVVSLLIKEDPYHSHPANVIDGSPLYLAASRGNSSVVNEILKNCKSPSYNGPRGTTALHGAIFSDSSDCVRKLVDWDTSLTKNTDVAGQTPLHYAAILNSWRSVDELMYADKFCAYIEHGDGKHTAFHLAASYGHSSIMQKIVSCCPDLWDMVSDKKRNVLHIAIVQGRVSTAEYIIENCPVISNVINQKDVDGNTPLHMIAISLCYVSKLVDHPFIDKEALNNKHLTVLDMLNFADYSLEKAERQREIVQELTRAGAHQDCSNSMNKDDIIEKNDRMRKASESETHLIVAALVATVSFAAGFTIPGGYQGNEGTDSGLAILKKKIAFKVFVIANTLALAFSVFAIRIYFKGAAKKLIDKTNYNEPAFLIQLSIMAMIIAFISGTYVSLAPSGIATANCIVASLLFGAVRFLTPFIRSCQNLMVYLRDHNLMVRLSNVEDAPNDDVL